MGLQEKNILVYGVGPYAQAIIAVLLKKHHRVLVPIKDSKSGRHLRNTLEGKPLDELITFTASFYYPIQVEYGLRAALHQEAGPVVDAIIYASHFYASPREAASVGIERSSLRVIEAAMAPLRGALSLIESCLSPGGPFIVVNVRDEKTTLNGEIEAALEQETRAALSLYNSGFISLTFAPFHKQWKVAAEVMKVKGL